MDLLNLRTLSEQSGLGAVSLCRYRFGPKIKYSDKKVTNKTVGHS